MTWFEANKVYMLQYSGLSRDALHIHIGIALFFLALWLLRRPPGSWLPAIIVLALCLVGEVFDVLHVAQLGQHQKPFENLHDIANTMLWPVVFTLFARWRNRVVDRGTALPADDGEIGRNGDGQDI